MRAVSSRPVRADAAMAAVILLLGLILTATGASLMERWRVSASRRQSLDFEDLLGIVANSVGLLIVAWWVLSLLIAFAAAILEKSGSRRAAAATGKFSPAFMRRLALAAVGMQLIAAPMANAADVAEGPAWGPTQEVAVSAAWTPTGGGQAAERQQLAERDDPTMAPPATGPSAAAPSSVPPGISPAAFPPAVTEPASISDLRPQWKPSPPVADPGLVTARPLRAAQEPSSATAGAITVLAGDTLWNIAARELGPVASDVDIALHWPRWYQANRAAIGENPDVLLPGQILKSPSAA